MIQTTSRIRNICGLSMEIRYHSVYCIRHIRTSRLLRFLKDATAHILHSLTFLIRLHHFPLPFISSLLIAFQRSRSVSESAVDEVKREEKREIQEEDKTGGTNEVREREPTSWKKFSNESYPSPNQSIRLLIHLIFDLLSLSNAGTSSSLP